MSTEKKCIAVHLPLELLDRINEIKQKNGLSQNGQLIDLIEKGLGNTTSKVESNNCYYFVKVRIDTSKMAELGQKIQSGELDTSKTIMTFCLEDDPTVGVSFWKVKDKRDFETTFSFHRPYYKEILEIIPVITPMESMKLLMQKIKQIS
jgi:metal-responsive CopG/Arc/MetJ family transcriptional regulator